jgi:hypothetical protein
MSRKVLVGLLVGALAAAVAIGGMSATAGTTTTKSHGNALVGTWQATIVLPAPAPPVHSVQAYTPGGSWVETSNQDPRSRSAMIGSWERIHGHLYAATGVHYLFNSQSGALVGSNKIDRTLEVAEDGQSFSVVARVTTFDASGHAVGAFTVHGTAERLPVDRIPDQP